MVHAVALAAAIGVGGFGKGGWWGWHKFLQPTTAPGTQVVEVLADAEKLAAIGCSAADAASARSLAAGAPELLQAALEDHAAVATAWSELRRRTLQARLSPSDPSTSTAILTARESLQAASAAQAASLEAVRSTLLPTAAPGSRAQLARSIQSDYRFDDPALSVLEYQGSSARLVRLAEIRARRQQRLGRPVDPTTSGILGAARNSTTYAAARQGVLANSAGIEIVLSGE